MNPVNVNRPMDQMNNNQSNMPHPMMSSKPSRAPWIVLAVVVVLVLAGLAFLFRNQLGAGSMTSKNVSEYQAVLLTNGQVYFGKLSDSRDKDLTLKDIFYLQVNQSQTLQNGQTAPATPAAQPELSLVKLGNELHGPVDEMSINRSQVLFIEKLKNDGKVVQAINAYKANPNGTTPAASGTAPATTTPATTTPAPTK